tara:strand:- start:459 stop:707 length:249 start_codon:yes stop_codon:yes gene_type:complete
MTVPLALPLIEVSVVRQHAAPADGEIGGVVRRDQRAALVDHAVGDDPHAPGGIAAMALADHHGLEIGHRALVAVGAGIGDVV